MAFTWHEAIGNPVSHSPVMGTMTVLSSMMRVTGKPLFLLRNSD